MAVMTSPWLRDDCYDPQHREAWARDDSGQLWHLHSTMGPGWGFVARHEPYDGTTVSVGKLADLEGR